MKYVMPIEDRRMVGVIGDYLRERNERDYVLFMTGVYLGRRISDILQYRVRDLRGKDRIAIAEQKTGEIILLPINPHLQKSIQGFFSRERRIMNLPSATAGASRTRRFPEYGYGRF